MEEKSKPKCVLHIGVHRTGTTSYQLTMSRARASLLAAGILYPAEPGAPLDKFIAHHGLAGQLTGDPLTTTPAEYRGPTLAQLEAEIDATKPSYLVLSSEAFSMGSKGNVDDSELIKLLVRKGFDITAVAVIRPQVEMLQSAYVEGVMSFFNYIKFLEYIRAAIVDPFFDYSKRLVAWTQSKSVSFVAIPYVNAVDQENLAHAILRGGGIPAKVVEASAIPRPERLHANPGALTVAAMRWLVPHLYKFQFSSFRDDLREFALQEADRRGWMQTPYQGYTNTAAKIVHDRYGKTNSEFSRKHWNKEWTEIFPQDLKRKRVSNEVDFDTISPSLRLEFEDFRKKLTDHHTSLQTVATVSLINNSGLTTTVTLPNCTLTFSNGILVGKSDR
jgi:hypothetical protein